MLKLFAAGLAFASLAAGAAAAQDTTRYAVRGVQLTGGTYGGEAAITESASSCRIVWVTTGGQESEGICMRSGQVFTAAYGIGDAVGLAVYRINDDGSLEGRWTIEGQAGEGSEILTPAP